MGASDLAQPELPTPDDHHCHLGLVSTHGTPGGKGTHPQSGQGQLALYYPVWGGGSKEHKLLDSADTDMGSDLSSPLTAV